jgi:hypothetical protein
MREGGDDVVLTENELDVWVRGNSSVAQGTIVETIWRLIAASSPNPIDRRFPLGDSVGQHGPDGELDVEVAYEPFVPLGRSFWEIGTGVDAGRKATSDFRDLTTATPEAVRKQATFVFVTPLSGHRDWEHTWKEDAKATWIEEHRTSGEWKDVRVIDGTKLIDWLRAFPSVELWLASHTLGLPPQQVETPEQRWAVLRSIGDPPPLIAELFLANREPAGERLLDILKGNAVHLRLSTNFPDQIGDFVAALISSLDDEARAEAAGRCLIVSTAAAWDALTSLQVPHILVAEPTLDLDGLPGVRLIQRARSARHAVVFGGAPGGVPEALTVSLNSPKAEHVKDALGKAGYPEERARTLSQRSAGNLGSLLRMLQGLSLLPEWADSSAAADLTIAEILGSWDESSPGDVEVVEGIAGNSYGAWIERIRASMIQSGAPLTSADSTWKFSLRFEAWYALGGRVYDEHLDRLLRHVTTALVERDPTLDLEAHERLIAPIRGTTQRHSHALRTGLSETLALLGSHPEAITSASAGRAELTAIVAVRRALAEDDWHLWASLDRLLPLLAEAAPTEVLDAMERGLTEPHRTFEALFAQEASGFLGRTHMSGTLWALETLAWSPDYLSRAALVLADLASRDPGGNWANRPINSLITIFLPWLPQTMADLARRRAAIGAVVREYPEVAWKLLVGLLPRSQSVSSGSRRPTFRRWISEDWAQGVTHAEYWEQVSVYYDLAFDAAHTSGLRMAELTNHVEDLPEDARERLIAHLESLPESGIQEAELLPTWRALMDVISRHRTFADAKWAMPSALVDRLETIAAALTPASDAVRFQRLFGERDIELYEGGGSFEEKREDLERRRAVAVASLAGSGGPTAIIDFAVSVESPWRVGFIYGRQGDQQSDSAIFPQLMGAGTTPTGQFAGGYVRGRFFSGGWSWVDEVGATAWEPHDRAAFLTLVPFDSSAWERADAWLGEQAELYWRSTPASPFESKADLTPAVERLLEFGRPFAAIGALYKDIHETKTVRTTLAMRALQAALSSNEPATSMSQFELLELIKAVQKDELASEEDLMQLEWGYLPLLDSHSGARPLTLERRLASDPEFFSYVIALVFKATAGDGQESLEGTPPESPAKEMAENGYRLLSEWSWPPGTDGHGGLDRTALQNWLSSVRAQTSLTGRREIAMEMVGRVLFHVPPDPDGLWLHRAAAEELDERDETDMRNGFRTEIFNSRGVHFVDPTGAPERELAGTYSQKADQLDAAGYTRLATAMRALAREYEREADRVVQRAGADD